MFTGVYILNYDNDDSWLGLASINFWSQSDRWLHSATVDQNQDWLRSWT